MIILLGTYLACLFSNFVYSSMGGAWGLVAYLMFVYVVCYCDEMLWEYAWSGE